jgi:hypothetical protein
LQTLVKDKKTNDFMYWRHCEKWMPTPTPTKFPTLAPTPIPDKCSCTGFEVTDVKLQTVIGSACVPWGGAGRGKKPWCFVSKGCKTGTVEGSDGYKDWNGKPLTWKFCTVDKTLVKTGDGDGDGDGDGGDGGGGEPTPTPAPKTAPKAKASVKVHNMKIVQTPHKIKKSGKKQA